MDDVCLCWLGGAGVALTAEGYVLAVDPFFTRPPFQRLWFGRVEPNRALIAEKLPRCDFILVTHSHYDHLLDVPAAARHTGALIYGSPNICRLALAMAAPQTQVRQIAAGERLTLGPFEVEVLPAEHGPTPLDRILSAPLPANLTPPLRLSDYRMDACFSFLIRAGPYRILHGEAPTPADLWLTTPARPRAIHVACAGVIRPRVVMPIHWDDFFRPLDQPIRPTLALPRCAWPPISRMNPHEFGRDLAALSPGVRAVVPEIFHAYNLDELLA